MASNMARIIMSSGLIAAVSAPPVHAGAWSVAGQGQLGVGYDDNVRFSSVNPVGAWNGQADVSGQLLYQDDAFLWRLSPHVQAVRYDGLQVLNRTDQYLTILTQKTTETNSTNLTLTGTRDTTLTSELGFTGLAEVNKQHHGITATVSNDWNLTERFDLSTQLYASVNHYIDAAFTGLVDYNYGSALMSADYDFTERSTLTFQASLGKLQVPDVKAYDKTTLSTSIGYAVQFAQRWHASVSVGPSQIRTQGRDQTGSVYQIAVTRKAERSDLSLSLTRDVTPNGLGQLSRRQQGQISWNTALGARWSTTWSASVTRNQNVLQGNQPAQDSVTYGDLNANLSWRLTPTWSASVAAGYSQQKLSGIALAADKRYATLGISWTGLNKTLN
jgi:hypothetical protein